ncbi:MAG: prolipoprotein diacylglyceryl transferase [Myxococcaceae bacterium]|jgi:phosphatidylglycerol:prolipoprotein diacylglycerol transferase|nr:prolipoprotein diacylglyceryl transferase [Myxococcaceae bacterium]MCA3013274.1 prolipoprotein diacylglyceryl transferase [Myxococcaceae bacterium]
MLPYLELPQLQLPLGQKIDLFGVLSTIGVGVGAALAARAARRYSPGDDGPLKGVVTWAVLFGLYGGHFLHLFGYHPEELTRRDPLLLLRFWEGLSSMGGVLGALVGIAVYFRRIGQPLAPYLDALALGVAPGWAIARFGCFLVHDHKGVKTDFPLAVAFPGGARHDLGLYDMLVLLALTGLLYAAARRRPRQGRLMGALAAGYSLCRFFLDFLRASDLSYVDRRYAGLTPAQYVVVGLFAVGIWLLTRPAPEAAQPGAQAEQVTA